VDFQTLLETAENTLVVVARFLALLELFKVGLCDFDQEEPLGPLLIHRTETSEDGVDLRTEGAWSVEEDETVDGQVVDETVAKDIVDETVDGDVVDESEDE